MAACTDVTAKIEILRLEGLRLRQGMVAELTVTGYRYDFAMWEKWCAEYGLPALPAGPETLSLYLTDLIQVQGKKITTARRRKCAIVHAHRAHGFESPASVAVMELLRGAQRIKAEKPRQMRPISVKELRAISIKLARVATDVAIRNRAILVVAVASALRRSSLVALNTPDLEFCRQGLIIHLQREKQDQLGKGRLIPLPRGKFASTCPVRVLRAWLVRRRQLVGDSTGPLFFRLDRRGVGLPLDGDRVTRMVKKCVALIGIDPSTSGAHSTRSAFISEAGEKNIGTLRIAAHTGQSEAMVARYYRKTQLWRNNAAAGIGL
jgi:site-specific recombinase XerD